MTAEKKKGKPEQPKTAETAAAKPVEKKTGEQPKPEKGKKERVALKKPRKSEASQKMREIIRRNKRRLPSFKGRFGKESIRKPSKEKWSKWRKPRGIDIQKTREDGAWPKPGYRSPKSIRCLHPSGYIEALVHNENQLNGLRKDQAARIARTVGKKKRREMLLKAQSMGIWVVNPLKQSGQ